MTDHEHAQLFNYLSQAELTDGFEYGKLGKNGFGSKLGALGQSNTIKRGRLESSDMHQLESDNDSLQLSGVENEILSSMRLKNKIIRDQGTTDNEGAIFSVYDSATDNDLMAFIGMSKTKSTKRAH